MGVRAPGRPPTMGRRARSPRIPKPWADSVGLSKRHPNRSLRWGNATICNSQSPCSPKTLDCGRLKGSLGGVCDATMTLAASIKLALRWPLFLISMALLYWSVVVGSLGGYIKFLDLKSEQRGDLFGWCALGLGGWPEVGVPRVPCRPHLTSARPYTHPSSLRSVAIKQAFGIRVLRVGKRDVYRKKCMFLVSWWAAVPRCRSGSASLEPHLILPSTS